MRKQLSILKPQAIYQIGQRKNNEDCIYPNLGSATSRDTFFMVCDGVGGHEKGEVASNLLCKHFSEYINKLNGIYNDGYLEKGLAYVESKFRDIIEIQREVEGMASTLTLIHLVGESVRVAWVGDSRIYQIRDGRIMFKSKDHSLVQDLLSMGEITEEEALVHPKRNIITRSVNGKEPARMDKELITDIREDDFFLLCTDGILETLFEEDFHELFTAEMDVFKAMEKVFSKAHGNTKDNFSMYLIKVGEKKEKHSWIHQFKEAFKI